MIGDLNETIKQLLVEGVPLDLSEIDVVFEKPDSEWSSSLSRPTINCYLYHVVENAELRRNDWRISDNIPAGSNGSLPPHRFVAKRRPPYRMDHHYLITAWANEVEDEHRLLWRILIALMRYNAGPLPHDKLQGELAEYDIPMPVKVGQQDSPIKNPTDFWSSMEVSIKPSVNFVITLPLDPEIIVTTPLVITRRVLVHSDLDEAGAVETPGLEFGGWVWSGEGDDARPVAGAEVLIVENGARSITDDKGRFKFNYAPYGSYTLRATADGERAERQIDLPGEDYDLVLGSSTGEASKGAQEGTKPPNTRTDGKSRRR